MAFGTKRRKRNVAVDRRIDSRRERERGRYNHYNYLAATVSLPRKRNREEEKEKKMEKKKMAEKRFGGCEQKMDITRKREGTRQVHRERLLYYSQANRCNDIRMPFVSFVVRYKTALRASNDIDHLRSFRPFSFSLPPFSYPMLSLSLSPSIRHTYPVLLVLPSPYLPFSATFSSASFTSSFPLLPLRHTSKRLGDTADRTD